MWPRVRTPSRFSISPASARTSGIDHLNDFTLLCMVRQRFCWRKTPFLTPMCGLDQQQAEYAWHSNTRALPMPTSRAEFVLRGASTINDLERALCENRRECCRTFQRHGHLETNRRITRNGREGTSRTSHISTSKLHRPNCPKVQLSQIG
jgi:hypothetical protein